MNKNIIFLSLLILFYCLDFYFRISTSLVVPQLMAQLKATPFEVASLASVFYSGYVIMQIPAGILMDRYSLKWVITPTILICTLSYIAFLFSTHFWTAYILRFVIGATSAFSFISVLYFARIYFSEKWFMLISGLTISMGTISASLIEVISATLVDRYDWHIVFMFFAVWGILIALLLMFVFPKPKKQRDKLLPQSFSWQNSKNIVLNKKILINGIIGGLFYLPTSLIAAMWGVPFLENSYHFSKVEAAFGITALFSGWVIGSPILSILARNIDKALLYIAANALIAMILSIIFISEKLNSHYGVLSILFLIGLCSSAQVIIWQIFKKNCPENQMGLGTSYTNMIILSQSAIFHLVIGFLINTNKQGLIEYQQGLLLIPAVFCLVAILSCIQLANEYRSIGGRNMLLNN